MVEGGPHREQAAFPCKDRTRNGLHRSARHGGERGRKADDNRGGGVVEQAGCTRAPNSCADGPDLRAFLAALQWPDQYGHYLYKRQPVDAVQLGFGNLVPTGTLVGGG